MVGTVNGCRLFDHGSRVLESHRRTKPLLQIINFKLLELQMDSGTVSTDAAMQSTNKNSMAPMIYYTNSDSISSIKLQDFTALDQIHRSLQHREH